MRFGLFGSAQARRSGPDTDSSQGFREFIDNNVEAEALGYYSTFLVEHHFTGFGQVSASLNLLTWLGARTRHLRLGTAVLVLPWHNPVLLAEQAATLDSSAENRRQKEFNNRRARFRRQGDRRSVEWLCRRDGRRLRACWPACDGCQGSGESGCWRAGRRAVCERTGRAGRPEPLLG